MAIANGGLRAIARKGFEERLRQTVVMGEKETARTLVVTKRIRGGVPQLVVNNIPFDQIKSMATSCGYDYRLEFGTDSNPSKLYLMKRVTS